MSNKDVIRPCRDEDIVLHLLDNVPEERYRGFLIRPIPNSVAIATIVLMLASIPAVYAMHSNAASLILTTLLGIPAALLAGYLMLVGILFAVPTMISQNPLGAALVIPLGGITLFFIARSAVMDLFRVNHLEFGPSGIAYNTGLHYGVPKQVSWAAVSSLRLEKPPTSNLPEEYDLLLTLGSGRKLRAPMKLLKNISLRTRLFQSLQRWAPHVDVSAELQELWEPEKRIGYTELWLQSLQDGQSRRRCGPLVCGDKLFAELYTVKSIVGAGGQGTAYLAESLAFQQLVVLKEFVLPIVPDRTERQRVLQNFETEVSVLKGLHNDAIVRLLDFFIEDFRAYLVLEYIHGPSLRKLVRESGPLSEVQVRELATQMVAVLRYLHGQSPPVVHRDFTPDNLLLDEDGKLKLIDFNVVHLLGDASTSSVVGKQPYLPKEQFRGQPVPASDLYALGCTLQYLLSGEDPEPLTQSRPILLERDISLNMDDIVSRLTEQDADSRPTLDELAELLRPAAAG